MDLTSNLNMDENRKINIPKDASNKVKEAIGKIGKINCHQGGGNKSKLKSKPKINQVVPYNQNLNQSKKITQRL